MGHGMGFWGRAASVGTLLGLVGCPDGEMAATDPGAGQADGSGGSTGAGADTTSGTSTTGEATVFGEGDGTGEPPPLELGCGRVPLAAVAAEYSHVPQVMGGEGAYGFEATGVPDGLIVNSVTGEIHGVPTQAGSYDVELTVTDFAGTQTSATCTIEVADPLSVTPPVDLLGDDVCVTGTGSLLDFVAPGTGDGSAITCQYVSGSGNGQLPDGITINARTCQIEGTTTDDRFGTHAFIVRGEQSGARIYVPYCVYVDDTANTFAVDGDHSGGTGVADRPIVRLFDPAAPLQVGAPGDPVYTVIDPTVCPAGSCYWGYVYGINSSPFDAAMFGLTDGTLIDDMAGNTIGLSHGLTMGGPPVARQYQDRPWILNISLNYCLSSVAADCAGVAAIEANAGAHLAVSVIMYPM